MNPKRSNNEKLHTQQNTVTYSNDLNKLALFDFTKREQLLFFSIVSFLKDQGDKPVTITFQQMKDTFQATKTFAANDKDFTELLSGIMNKIFSRKITKPNGAILMVYLLTYHLVDPEDKTLTVKVNPDFAGLFNYLNEKYTEFELIEFAKLRTKYSQRLYTLLKQYKKTGVFQIEADTLHQILEISCGYTVKDIGKRIITPSVRELTQYFPDLDVEKIKKGRTIAAYRFTFTPEGPIIDAEAKTVNDPLSPAPEKVLCPRCGKEMILRASRTGGTFWGHRRYDETECTAYYDTREDMEADREKLRKEQTEKQHERSSAQDAWEKAKRDQQKLTLAGRGHLPPDLQKMFDTDT